MWVSNGADSNGAISSEWLDEYRKVENMDTMAQTNLEYKIGCYQTGQRWKKDKEVLCPICGDSSIHLAGVHVSTEKEDAAWCVGPEYAAVEFFCEACGGRWSEAFRSHEGSVSKTFFSKSVIHEEISNENYKEVDEG